MSTDPNPPSQNLRRGQPQAPQAEVPPRGRKPWLAAFLQFGCLFAGLGYAYLGRWGSFGKAIGIWLVLQAINAVCATLEYKGVAMAVSPTLFIFQVLTAYDAWKLARGEDRVPLVSWL